MTTEAKISIRINPVYIETKKKTKKGGIEVYLL